MQPFTIGSKTASIFPNSESETPIIFLNTFSGEGQKIFETAQATGCTPFTLVAISVLDWNHDMVAWDSPPVFKNADACTGGADNYLRLLTEEIIPTAEREINGVPRWRGIAGYSLAGLFALYTIYQTDLFSRVGSISSSLWFPGMKEYIFSHEPQRRPASTSPWEIGRAKPEIQFCGASGRTQRRFTPSIEARALIRRSS